MERFSIDTQIFDLIAASDETVDLLVRLAQASKIELVSTHVQQDELAAMSDQVKRQRIARIPVPEGCVNSVSLRVGGF